MNTFNGQEIYKWAKDLFPICRSLAGPGNLKTLEYLREINSNLKIKSFKCGESVFDWKVPDEWHIKEAWIKDEDGKEIINFKKNNLHVLNYSHPVDRFVSLKDLDDHLFSIPERENAIPYVTSYYSKNWGFCIEHSKRKQLKDQKYHVFIDSEFVSGEMHYGECIIKGKSNKEILLSTYICHPSMANNELSGPTVTSALIKEISKLDNFYTYRILFLPETIGPIAYISKKLKHLKKNVVAGFVVTCVGDDKEISFLPSRSGNTISDRAAIHALDHIDSSYIKYKWIHRGSDERQYCSPGVDLPISTIMRSKYGTYPEYHTSDDDLNFISPKGLEESSSIIFRVLTAIEKNCFPKVNFICEPMLGKRGLYPNHSTLESQRDVQVMLDLISYSDGTKDLIEIASLIEQPIWNLYELIDNLSQKGVISLSKS
tara:strand:+ start:7780 stop:9066 length:1287 start_codon:yes stop_codon:yes gene_type:complete